MTHSNTKPQIIEQLGYSLYAFNHNVTQGENGYMYETIYFDFIPSYADVVNRVITDKYGNGAEMAIQRKAIIDNQNAEFVEYNEFVEKTKAWVKNEFENQA